MKLKVIDLPGAINEIKLNKIYEVKYIDTKVLTNPYFRDHAHELYEVFDDGISIGMYSRCYFENIEENRNNKLNELGI